MATSTCMRLHEFLINVLLFSGVRLNAECRVFKSYLAKNNSVSVSFINTVQTITFYSMEDLIFFEILLETHVHICKKNKEKFIFFLRETGSISKFMPSWNVKRPTNDDCIKYLNNCTMHFVFDLCFSPKWNAMLPNFNTTSRTHVRLSYPVNVLTSIHLWITWIII